MKKEKRKYKEERIKNENKNMDDVSSPNKDNMTANEKVEAMKDEHSLPLIRKEDCVDYPNQELKPTYVMSKRKKLYFFDEKGFFTQILPKKLINIFANHLATNEEEAKKIRKQYDEKTGIMKTALKRMHEYRKEFLEKDMVNEMLGYPEFSEKYFKIHRANRQEISMKFKDYENFLRIYLSNKVTYERVLASICANDNIEYFERFRETFKSPKDITIAQPDRRQIVLDRLSMFVDEHQHLPHLRTFFESILNVRYIDKVAKDWILEGADLDEAMETLLIEYKKKLVNYIPWFYKNVRSETSRRNEIIRAAKIFDTTFVEHMIKEDIFDTLEEDYDNSDLGMIIHTGIQELDDRKLYLQKSKLFTICGHAGGFKTTLAINITHNLLKQKLNVAYLWLETAKREIYYNLLSKHSCEDKFKIKIPHMSIKHKKLPKKDKKYLFENVYADFRDNYKDYLQVITKSDLNEVSRNKLDTILEEVDNDFIKKSGKGIDVLVVDNVNLLKYDSEKLGNNEYSLINHYMKKFETMASDFLHKKKDIAILTLAQISRQGYKNAKSHGGVYDLTDIAESNEIERSSSIIIGAFKGDNGTIKISNIKCRDNDNEECFDIKVNPVYYNILNSNRKINESSRGNIFDNVGRKRKEKDKKVYENKEN